MQKPGKTKEAIADIEGFGEQYKEKYQGASDLTEKNGKVGESFQMGSKQCHRVIMPLIHSNKYVEIT